MRVLVVEDHRRLATALAEGLRREGMATDTAYDGQDALTHVAINRYDVVVLDGDLPGVHGDRVCRMLAEPDASATTLRATCEELLQSGREQERLLEALLTLASSERGLERREPVDLAALCGRVMIPLRSEFDRRSIELKSVLAPARTNGDPALIERLVGNLLDNAVRYNRAGGRVEIRTATDNGHSTVSVVNTGPMVAPDAVEGLFEPFKRPGDDRTVSDGHHGLGLSIVRAIATAHGATLTAQAPPEGGLAVTVTFEAN